MTGSPPPRRARHLDAAMDRAEADRFLFRMVSAAAGRTRRQRKVVAVRFIALPPPVVMATEYGLSRSAPRSERTFDFGHARKASDKLRNNRQSRGVRGGRFGPLSSTDSMRMNSNAPKLARF